MVVADLPGDVFFDSGKKRIAKLSAGLLQRIQSYHLRILVAVEIVWSQV
jgi:hypothetical protein